MNNSAKDTMKEQLSALMDGELSRSESTFLIKRMGHDPELRALWQRQCMARDVLRNEHPAQLDFTLADRIRADIEAEPEVVLSSHTQLPSENVHVRQVHSWLRPLAGLAVAASVASVAIVGWQGMQQPTGLDGTVMNNAFNEFQPAAGNTLRGSEELWVTQGLQPRLSAQNASLGPQSSDRLNAYLLQHQEQSMMIGAPGWIPYSRIVGRDVPDQQTYIVGGQ